MAGETTGKIGGAYFELEARVAKLETGLQTAKTASAQAAAAIKADAVTISTAYQSAGTAAEAAATRVAVAAKAINTASGFGLGGGGFSRRGGRVLPNAPPSFQATVGGGPGGGPGGDPGGGGSLGDSVFGAGVGLGRLGRLGAVGGALGAIIVAKQVAQLAYGIGQDIRKAWDSVFDTGRDRARKFIADLDLSKPAKEIVSDLDKELQGIEARIAGSQESLISRGLNLVTGDTEARLLAQKALLEQQQKSFRDQANADRRHKAELKDQIDRLREISELQSQQRNQSGAFGLEQLLVGQKTTNGLLRDILLTTRVVR